MPSRFMQKMQDLGVAWVSYGSFWFCDESDSELKIFGFAGEELALPWKETSLLGNLIYERISASSLGHTGWHTLDLRSGALLESGYTIEYVDAGQQLGELFSDPNLLFQAATAPLERGESFFHSLMQHSDVLVRRAVAQNPNLTVDMLEPLLFDSDEQVLELLKRHPCSSALAEYRQNVEQLVIQAKDELALPRALEALSHTVAWTVRAAVAANPSTPSRVLLRLLEDKHEGVRLAALASPNVPAELREKCLAPYQNLHGEALIPLLHYPILPANLLERWSAFPDFPAQGVLHPSSPERVALHWLGEVEIYTRSSSFSVPDGACCAFRVLGFKRSQLFFAACEQARKPLPFLIQQKLSRSSWARVRAELAISPHTDPQILRTLAADPHSAVQRATLANPHTPLEVLLEALEDGKEADLYALATNSALSWEYLSKLNHPNYIQFLATSPNVPAHLLEEWYWNRKLSLHHTIANNPALPLSIQWKTLEQAQPRIMNLQSLKVWSEPIPWEQTQDSVLERGFSFQSDYFLDILACSRGTSPIILQEIWKRFGIHMAPKLLQNPTLEPSLVHEIYQKFQEIGQLEGILASLHQHPQAPTGLPPLLNYQIPPWWQNYTYISDFEPRYSESEDETKDESQNEFEPTTNLFSTSSVQAELLLQGHILPPFEDESSSPKLNSAEPALEDIILWQPEHLEMLEGWICAIFDQIDWQKPPASLTQVPIGCTKNHPSGGSTVYELAKLWISCWLIKDDSCSYMSRARGYLFKYTASYFIEVRNELWGQKSYGKPDLQWQYAQKAVRSICQAVLLNSESRPEMLVWVASMDNHSENLDTHVALCHPRISPLLLEFIAVQDRPWPTWTLAVAQNPALPLHLATLLLDSHSSKTLIALAQNPATPKHILEELARDEDPNVGQAAQKALEGKV